MSSLTGAAPLRARSRDRLLDVEATWHYVSAEMAAWRTWFEQDLLSGQRWFALIAPGEGGFVARVARFRPSTIRRELLGNGVFRVSASLQVRGASVPPVTRACFVERFYTGLTQYNSVGDTSIYSIVSTEYGSTMKVGPQNGGSANRMRTFDELVVARVAFKFRLSALNVDDSCLFVLRDSDLNIRWVFLPYTVPAGDPFRRPQVGIGASAYVVAPAPLAAGTWFQFEMQIAPGANNSVVTLTNLATMTLLQQTTLSGSHSPPTVDRLDFYIDSSALTCVTEYADIEICEA